MAVGSYEYCLEKTLLRKISVRCTGVNDYHSHLRIQPIIKLARRGFFDDKNVVEFGCGRGLNGFEIYFHSRKAFRNGHFYIGMDTNSKEVDRGNRCKNFYHADGLSFINEDAWHFLAHHDMSHVDVILLIDVIEHIEDDLRFLQKLKSLTNENVTFVISVPTKKYPEVFGRKFHEAIGHVRDGYDLTDLKNLMKNINRRLAYSSRNTFLRGVPMARLFSTEYYHQKEFLDVVDGY